MTTFLSYSPTVNGYSFNSSFWLPSFGPFYTNQPTPDFVYSLTSTPENVYYQSTELFTYSGNAFELHSVTSRTVDVSGSSMYMGPWQIMGGYIEYIYSSLIEISNYFIIENSANIDVLQSQGYSIYGLNLEVPEILASYENGNAWKLVTRGDDFFDATVPASIIQSQDFLQPSYWAQSIHAGPGNDTILASPGRDYLIGGTGGNAIRAGAGPDVVYAGDNVEQPLQDIWSVAYGEADLDYVWAGWGSNAWLDGGSGDDVLWDGLGRDVLIGGAGNDTLVAENGTNYIMVFAEDVRAGEIDTVYSFTAAENYLQLPAAWQGKVGTYFDGSTTFLVLPTDSGDFYVQVWGVAPEDVWSHVYFA